MAQSFVGYTQLIFDGQNLDPVEDTINTNLSGAHGYKTLPAKYGLGAWINALRDFGVPQEAIYGHIGLSEHERKEQLHPIERAYLEALTGEGREQVLRRLNLPFDTSTQVASRQLRRLQDVLLYWPVVLGKGIV